ncbi:MazG family protein [Blastococcus sp. VKM Ac-2987]|uniref:MazG family protein n=1 Tax=Blastococcus sp. VKM Ac-2987 TaxID=3004141 RepID=UPI0022AB8AA3|nr:MazG family protein [Blastococcus sp. VKM Ac-2987]MCZ2858113.1 MazG family protein [Blastococcus sp. VKM Ac-2987]
MPVVLVVTVNPRLPALLGASGWQAVTGDDAVVALPGAAAEAGMLRAAGVRVEELPDAVAAAARADPVVCLASPAETAALPGVPAVAGAPEPPGARLLDVVTVMDRLRSPGGCPWDAEQTHASLRGYLLEEAHEAYDAIVDDDPVAMREELGDVLLQVVFHARVAAEAGEKRRFDVDDVAGDLVDKLVRRHPHVFGDAGPRDFAQVEAGWDEIKKAEKQRRSPTEGVSRSQPAASWGAALVRRAGRAGLPTPAPAELTVDSPEALGERLLAVVAAAEARGWDAEDALREAVRRYAGELDAEAEERARA